MTGAERAQLDEQGFVLLEGAMGHELHDELRRRLLELYHAEGDRAGHEFRQEPHAQRLANLVNKDEVFARAIVLSIVSWVLSLVVGNAKRVT